VTREQTIEWLRCGADKLNNEVRWMQALSDAFDDLGYGFGLWPIDPRLTAAVNAPDAETKQRMLLEYALELEEAE
jgi:hypothetical protein